MQKRSETIKKQFGCVLRYCEKWGISVDLLKEHYDKACYRMDFHGFEDLYGITWVDRRIYCPIYEGGEVCREIDEEDPHLLLHELSHCVIDVPPSRINEVESEMLAFEHYSCRYLRLAGRSEFMRDYPIQTSRWLETSTSVWGGISMRERANLIKTSLSYAVEAGILDATGKPTFTRAR